MREVRFECLKGRAARMFVAGPKALALVAFVVGITGSPALAAPPEEMELFVLWGLEGRWDGSLEIRDGRLAQV